MGRVKAEQLEEILGERLDVLDDGFVRVVDYMGNDTSVVQAARVSYGEGTKKVHQDEGLIRYLIRHRHSTPFEMCEIKLHLRVPMDCWRQWIRHRTASVNEYSTRYSLAIDATQATLPADWRLQSSRNRQGSSEFLPESTGSPLSDREHQLHTLSREIYSERIDHGVAREQARKDLPLSTYTEAYWKIDLHNLLHFLDLRMDDHAQHEIREYAKTIGHKIVAIWCPATWNAFLDYRRNAVPLSAREIEVISNLNRGLSREATVSAIRFGWLSPDGARKKSNRELQEFADKANRLGVELPW